jgi:hypothetical protein
MTMKERISADSYFKKERRKKKKLVKRNRLGNLEQTLM